ncbi:hypothetical protein APS56_06095 [Pseudalgibacter alginicilyticus]|uniref:Uncharacterized protein n=1 Tax=Pseudalgibacter alginicilyticus TaxID=1736674 RepID=A0A0P0CFB2_9FLAO|nr:hypothetical protein [Pseudalgibacter alginicilyticus]ALJ04724.1 hypothetical protein APS56_06095 [Pseudalgibacter alginicilyticus]
MATYINRGITNYAKENGITVKNNDEIYVLVQNNKEESKIYEYQIEHSKSHKVEIPSRTLAVIIIKI